jgi:hypothetical protein
MSSSTEEPVLVFPLEARVILHGLVKAPDLNGKVGIVKSSISNAGRYSVHIEDANKTVGLKPINLRYEPRTVDSLSVKELKMILKSKKVDESEIKGIDKTELQTMVSELVTDEGELPELLAKAKSSPAPTPAAAAAARTRTTSTAASNNVDPMQAAEQLQNMSPEQLRQQARMMKSMDPSQLRRMNPQLANMTDEQIRQAAVQMEMMANNPSMMKMAAEQMKNMSPDQVQQMQAQVQSGGTIPTSSSTPTTSTTAGTTPTPATQQAQQAAQAMANMTPEQMREQAKMLRNMDPDIVRRTNPQLAHMTDEQIKMAAAQFEMMADNPQMMKMAMDQMKNLSPEQMEAMRNGSASAPPDMMGGEDPSKILANMDKTQLKQMLQMVRDNPELLKQYAAMSGVPEEQFKQGVDAFAGMSDAKMDAALKVMQTAQKAKETWTQVNARARGHLPKILIAAATAFVGLIVWYLFFRSSTPAVASSVGDSVPDIGSETPNAVVQEDEFASEF